MKIQNRAKICLCVSIAIMLIAAVMSLTGHGINYGIDFAGGLNLQYNMGAAYDKADVEEALKAQGIEEFVVSSVGSDGTTVQIRVPTLSSEDEVQNLQNGGIRIHADGKARQESVAVGKCTEKSLRSLHETLFIV